MWQPALAASFLLIGQVSAGVISDVGRVARRGVTVEEKMRRFVDTVVEPVERREFHVIKETMGVAAWDAQTTAACTSALEMLNGVASNDAGLAVCYNLPYLDNSTGVFQADLRLFTISPPKGQFANIPTQNVSVALSYVGATVSPIDAASMIAARDERVSLISWPRNEVHRRQTAAIPTIAQSYAFVGQINKDLLTSDMSSSTLERLLVPKITLTGTDTTGTKVNATLAEGEATFVSGVFAQPIIASKTAVQPPIQTLVVASDAPFVVPGLNILIFPIGGIITGVWTVLFIGTIAYGTIGRIQFRDQYRRRSAAAKGVMPRI